MGGPWHSPATPGIVTLLLPVRQSRRNSLDIRWHSDYRNDECYRATLRDSHHLAGWGHFTPWYAVTRVLLAED